MERNLKMNHKLLGFICILTLAGFNLSAQNEASIWYFGNEAGLRFTETSIEPIKSKLNTLEGCAAIADAEGNLIFYTDGVTVFNKGHKIMENGNDLAGHYSATQSAIIVPAPGKENQYYIFTTDHEGGSKGLNYSIINMEANAGEGKVIVKNINLYPAISEKVTSVFHRNQKDIWIITYDWKSGKLLSFPITASGIGKAVISETGIKGGNRKDAIGQLTISSDGSKVAIARYGSSRVDVFQYSNYTGSAGSAILSKELQNAYGAAFSASGKVLYCSSWIKGNKNFINQYFLHDNESPSAQLITNTDKELGQLQLAPNGQIIIAMPGQKFLGSIAHPEKIGAACLFKENSIHLGGEPSKPPFSQGGLPAVNQSYNIPQAFDTRKCNLSVDIGNDTTLCEGDILKVKLNDPQAQYTWSTGSVATEIKIEQTGKYWIKAKKENCIAGDTININIIPAPAVSISYMKGEQEDIVLTALGNADHFEWEGNIYNNKKIISAPGNYRLIIKKDGCRTEKIIRIK